jgi:hypothetical protein
MNRLTLEERRRVYLAQQRARATMLARLQAETVEALPPPSGRRRLRGIARLAIIGALLGGGLLAAQALEFHSPDLVAGVLLPRR